MIIHTASQSIYEFDLKNKRVRRLHGIQDATKRQGDNLWRQYQEVVPDPIQIGMRVMIVWTPEEELLPDTQADVDEVALPTTITNIVVSIVEEEILS